MCVCVCVCMCACACVRVCASVCMFANIIKLHFNTVLPAVNTLIIHQVCSNFTSKSSRAYPI